MNTNTLRFTLKEIKGIDEFDAGQRREIIEAMEQSQDDFTVGDYRFIRMDAIDGILKDELLADEYILGCFNAWFVADITGLDTVTVEKAQKSENFELLGALMAKNIEAVVEGYVSADGYGHHFNPYNGDELEVGEYYAFRIG